MNYYFDSSSEKAALLLSIRLKSIINTKKKPNQEIIILCIGSDRSTGDSLGPLIGYKLKESTSMWILHIWRFNAPCTRRQSSTIYRQNQ